MKLPKWISAEEKEVNQNYEKDKAEAEKMKAQQDANQAIKSIETDIAKDTVTTKK